MRRHARLASTIGLAMMLGASVLFVAIGATPAQYVTSDGVDVVQSYEEALAQDLELIADARGWTSEEAQLYFRAEQAIGRVAVEVAAKRPDMFVGSALSRDPSGPPTLFIKGPADSFIAELVSAAGVEIVVADNQPFSFDELEARKIRVHRALQALGFTQVVTRVNITGAGVIPAAVRLEPGLAATAEAILSAIPADLRSSVELTFHDAPIVVPEAAFGGMSLLDAGFLECTSGWTVQRVGSSTRGISGADHCISVDQVSHANPPHNHATAWQNGHAGQWGDVEWYTTNQAEADDFYADVGLIRDVAAVEPRAAIAVNESICVFGWASFDRDCSLDVLDASIACGALDRLVQMDGDTQIGGDSGGGWSFNFTAYGGHFGNCGGLDSFSVADLFDEALGIFVPVN